MTTRHHVYWTRRQRQFKATTLAPACCRSNSGIHTKLLDRTYFRTPTVCPAQKPIASSAKEERAPKHFIEAVDHGCGECLQSDRCQSPFCATKRGWGALNGGEDRSIITQGGGRKRAGIDFRKPHGRFIEISANEGLGCHSCSF